MSSHHVVRENQEPAVFLLNSENCDLKVLNQALEWSPFVITSDNSYKFLIEHGIKVDIVFCKKNTFSDAFDQSNLLITTYEGGVIPSVINFLKARGHHAVYIFAKAEKATLEILEQTTDMTINVIDGNKRLALISGTLSKWFPENHLVSVIGSEVKVYRSGDPLPLQDLKPTKNEGVIKFSSSMPFWLVEVFS